MRFLKLAALPVLAASLLGLGACKPKELIGDAPQGAQTVVDCAAHAEKPWNAGTAGTFSATAETMGPDCPKAVVTLVIRSSDGAPLLAWAAKVEDIFGLYDAPDRAAMTTALSGWIDQVSSSYKTTADIEEWTKGAEGPGKAGEEFPFHPESWYDRDGWEAMRAQKAPVFTFPQGHESIAVYMLGDGRMELVGVKQFPG
jgi:hypothetical protein